MIQAKFGLLGWDNTLRQVHSLWMPTAFLQTLLWLGRKQARVRKESTKLFPQSGENASQHFREIFSALFLKISKGKDSITTLNSCLVWDISSSWHKNVFAACSPNTSCLIPRGCIESAGTILLTASFFQTTEIGPSLLSAKHNKSLHFFPNLLLPRHSPLHSNFSTLNLLIQHTASKSLPLLSTVVHTVWQTMCLPTYSWMKSFFF